MSKYVLILSILCFQFSVSQNLVLNPSFEEYKRCPSLIGGFNSNVINWSTPNFGTTDYFNSCSKEVGIINFFGNQNAKTGKGYGGMYVMAPENYKEYIQGKLSSSLTADKKYTITFYISLAENCSHAIRDLGMLFLKKPLKQDSDKFINLNMVLNENANSYFVLINSQDYYNEKEGWEKVTFEYLAKGFETHFIIGSFDKNRKISKIKVHNTKDPDASYYYIDDVSVLPFETEQQTKVDSNSIENSQILENDKVYTLQNVLFDFDKHTLLKSSKLELDQLYNYLNANKRLQIEIYGPHPL